jgi:hypothetical protein
MHQLSVYPTTLKKITTGFKTTDIFQTIIVKDFNTPLSKIYRSKKKQPSN